MMWFTLVACLWESLKYAGTVITAFFTLVPGTMHSKKLIQVKNYNYVSGPFANKSESTNPNLSLTK